MASNLVGRVARLESAQRAAGGGLASPVGTAADGVLVSLAGLEAEERNVFIQNLLLAAGPPVGEVGRLAWTAVTQPGAEVNDEAVLLLLAAYDECAADYSTMEMVNDADYDF